MGLPAAGICARACVLHKPHSLEGNGSQMEELLQLRLCRVGCKALRKAELEAAHKHCPMIANLDLVARCVEQNMCSRTLLTGQIIFGDF
jgi:hypothetical protein